MELVERDEALAALRRALDGARAGHHVSSILRKLDVPNRARAAAAGAALLEGGQPAARR